MDRIGKLMMCRISFWRISTPIVILGILTALALCVRVIPLWSGYLIFAFLIISFLLSFSRKILITEEEINHKAFGKTTELKWNKIVQAYLSESGDFPGFFETLHLKTSDGQKMTIPFTLFSNHVIFLQEILSQLPDFCEVDPNLRILTERGNKFKWETFLKTEIKSILIGLCLLIGLIFIIWLVIGFSFNYWRWNI